MLTKYHTRRGKKAVSPQAQGEMLPVIHHVCLFTYLVVLGTSELTYPDIVLEDTARGKTFKA
jgi:hypothetical protein